MRRFIAALLVFIALSTAAHAQPLADKVPANALVYIGWTGSSKLGTAYEQSRLKAFLQSSDLPELFTEFLPKVSAKVGSQNMQAGAVMELATSIASRMWRHPTAVYWAGVDFADPRNPQPRLGVICDAGNEAGELTKELQKAIEGAGKTKVPIKLIPQGNLVTLLIGPEQPGVAGQPNLAADARFTTATKQLQSNPVATAFVDLGGIVALIDNAPARGRRGAENRANWTKLRDALALDKLSTFAWAGGFDGQDWSTGAFLAAPAPRTGLLAILDSAKVSDDILKLVPSSATMVMAGTFDPGKMLTGIRATAAKVDPNAPAQMDQGLDRFRTMTGVDLQKDLLDPLGDQWAFYSDPTLAGTYSFCGALLNRPDDPAKIDASLARLAQSLSNLISQAMGSKEITIRFHETKTPSGLTIHYLGTPLVRPSWAVKNGVLYVGITPQVVAAAAAQTPTTGKSILDAPAFAAVRKRLDQPAATSIRFIDLQRTAPMMYPTWMFVSGYANFGDLFGVPAPAMILPPLTDLLPQLAPAGSVSWTDDAGWHSHGITPFPGATLVGSDPSLTATTPLLVSILLPSLNRARETANRVKCASNERQIGQAILLYANENRGKYPPDLGTLIKTQDITIDAFVCPSAAGSIPPDVLRGPIDAKVKWVNENSAYVYVGQNLNFNAAADTVVLYERADNHDEDGLNFLYGDGHVEWQNMEMAQQLIKNVEAHEAIKPGAR